MQPRKIIWMAPFAIFLSTFCLTQSAWAGPCSPTDTSSLEACEESCKSCASAYQALCKKECAGMTFADEDEDKDDGDEAESQDEKPADDGKKKGKKKGPGAQQDPEPEPDVLGNPPPPPPPSEPPANCQDPCALDMMALDKAHQAELRSVLGDLITLLWVIVFLLIGLIGSVWGVHFREQKQKKS